MYNKQRVIIVGERQMLNLEEILSTITRKLVEKIQRITNKNVPVQRQKDQKKKKRQKDRTTTEMDGMIDFKCAPVRISKSYTVVPLDLYHSKQIPQFELDETYVRSADDSKSHHFPGITAQELKEIWDRLVLQNDRVTLVQSDEAKEKYCYCYRSKILGMREYITVQFINVEDSSYQSCSTFALHCTTSKRGKKRMERKIQQWLNQLHAFIATAFISESYRHEYIQSPCTP